MASAQLRIGVLALQGAFREHVSLLRGLRSVTAVEIRTVDELFSVSGLIIPGGESTTIALIAQQWGLMKALVQFRQQGRPIWGTCAGLILLAEDAEGVKKGGQALIGGLDVKVARNFFGAQLESFETTIPVPSCLAEFGRDPFRAVFIRAPAIVEIGSHVQTLCRLTLDEEQQKSTGRSHVVVAVQSATCLATAFHPELTGDNRWHRLFVKMVQDYQSISTHSTAISLPTIPQLKCTVPSDLPVYGETQTNEIV